METTNKLIDQVKAKYDLHSDYALAKKLGMSRERISKYRNIGGAFGDDVAVKVAELLDLDVGYVLACAAFERAKTEVSRNAWQHAAEILKTYGAAAALLLLVAVPSLTPTPANAAATLSSGGSMYIMLNARRLIRALLSSLGLPGRMLQA